jgi:hypothetical protein
MPPLMEGGGGNAMGADLVSVRSAFILLGAGPQTFGLHRFPTVLLSEHPLFVSDSPCLFWFWIPQSVSDS